MTWKRENFFVRWIFSKSSENIRFSAFQVKNFDDSFGRFIHWVRGKVFPLLLALLDLYLDDFEFIAIVLQRAPRGNVWPHFNSITRTQILSKRVFLWILKAPSDLKLQDKQLMKILHFLGDKFLGPFFLKFNSQFQIPHFKFPMSKALVRKHTLMKWWGIWNIFKKTQRIIVV